MDGDQRVLTCECQKRCGALQRTVAVLDGSCNSFGNRDGELFCDKEMENDANVPRGKYEETCGGCSYDAGERLLRCTRCRGSNGELVTSELKVTEGCFIANRAGTLVCDNADAPDVIQDVKEEDFKIELEDEVKDDDVGDKEEEKEEEQKEL